MISLRLFLCGSAPSSRRALENVQSLISSEDIKSTSFEVVDVLADPASAEAAQIFATPALVLERDRERRVVVGDLSDREKVLHALGLRKLMEMEESNVH